MHCLIAIEIIGPQVLGENRHWQTCRAGAGYGFPLFPFWLSGLVAVMVVTGPIKCRSPRGSKIPLSLGEYYADARLRALDCLLLCRAVPFVVWWIIHQPGASLLGFCLLFLHLLIYWMIHLTCFMCLALMLWSWNLEYGIDKNAFSFNFQLVSFMVFHEVMFIQRTLWKPSHILSGVFFSFLFHTSKQLPSLLTSCLK